MEPTEEQVMERADTLMRRWYTDGRIGCDCGNPFNHDAGCDLVIAQATAEELAYQFFTSPSHPMWKEKRMTKCTQQKTAQAQRLNKT